VKQRKSLHFKTVNIIYNCVKVVDYFSVLVLNVIKRLNYIFTFRKHFIFFSDFKI
jgi:hypothetical protein